MGNLLQRRIVKVLGTSKGSGETVRGSGESREAFLNRSWAAFPVEEHVAVVIDLNAQDEIVTERFSISGADVRSSLDMAREQRQIREQRDQDADSDFQYLD